MIFESIAPLVRVCNPPFDASLSCVILRMNEGLYPAARHWIIQSVAKYIQSSKLPCCTGRV